MNPEANVMAFGCVGDGVNDDTPGWRRAVAFRKKNGPGVIRVPRPPVRYMVQPLNYSFSDRYPSYTGTIDLDFGEVSVIGEESEIYQLTPGGGDPNTSFVLTPPWADDNPGNTPLPYPAWLPSHAYNPGEAVTGPNGHAYIAKVLGTSGTTGPLDINPATAGAVTDGGQIWALADRCFRGNIFRIKTFALNANGLFSNILFKDLVLNGGAPRDGLIESIWPMASFPVPSLTVPYDQTGAGPTGANIPAGIGWNSPFGHMPISMPNPYVYGAITLENVVLKNWRSEALYRADGSSLAGKFTMRLGAIQNCSGDGISMSCPADFDGIDISNVSQGIENDPIIFEQSFRRLNIRDCGIGLSLPSNYPHYDGRARTVVENCKIYRCSEAGILINGYMANVVVRDTDVIDCAQIGAFPCIYVLGDAGGEPQDLDFINVNVIADTRTSLGGWNLNVGNVGAVKKTVRLMRCGVFRTAGAVANGFIIVGAATGFLGAQCDLQLLDCDWRGSGGQPTWAGAGVPTIRNNRIDGLYAVVAPNLNPQWHAYYEMKPGGAVNLTTPLNFPDSTEVKLVISTNVTLVHGAGVLELAGGVNFTPGAAGATIWLERAAGATKVKETRRLAY